MEKQSKDFPQGCKRTGRFLCALDGIQKKVVFSIMPVCFIVCFSLLLYGISQEKLKEKFIDIQADLELLTLHSDVGVMLNGIEYIDGLPHIFAALYDSEFAILNYRSPEPGTAPFDPRKNKDFLMLVENNLTGTIPIIWEDLEGGISRRKMHTCFRWVTMPTGNTYLMAAGVSAYSLISPALNWFIGVPLGLITISMLSMLGYAIFVVRDLYLHFRRQK